MLAIVGSILTGENSKKSLEEKQELISQEPQDRETPKKTDLEILAEIENRLNEYEKMLKEYYPDESMLKTLSEDLEKLIIL